MRVRRRSALLSAAFLTLATLTARPTSATAQPPDFFQPPPPRGFGPPPPGEALTPEQIRTALLRLSGQAGDFPKDLTPFADAIKDKVLKQNPGIDPKLLDNAIRKIVNDPARMKQLRDIAEKQAASGGKTPSAADIGKMFKNLPNDVPGLPPDIGNQLGKQFGQGIPTPPPDPGRTQPQPVPGGRVPPNFPQPDPGRVQPPVPQPDPGRVQPRPEPGKTDTAKPPEKKNFTPELTPAAPPQPVPPQPRNATPPAAANPERPPDPFERTPEDKARGKALRALAGAWERNIGPLSETPSVQRALTELVTGVGDMKDADGNSVWDAFEKNMGGGEGFADWLNGASLGGDWKMPSWNLPSWNFGRGGTDFDGGSSSSSRRSWWNRSSSPRSSSGGSGGSGGGFGIPGLEGTWVPVVLLAAVLLGALVWWRFVYLRDPARQTTAFAIAGLGPWPLDPNRLASREDVVLAFEYLSVLICGPEAKTWTHATIAEALTGLARTHGEAAIMLARLYELARYAPLSEPLTTAELAEARRLVCGLAGVAQV